MIAWFQRISNKGPAARVGLVLAGYAIALLVAIAAVALHVHLGDPQDRVLSSGMHAFGDAIVFLGVLALASVPATGAALHFLRPCRAFWRVASVAAVLFAATAIPAVMDHFAPPPPGLPGAPLSAGRGLWSLRLLLAPFPGLAFFMAGLFAPAAGFRVALFGAMAVEAVAFACLAAGWFIAR
ncbi:MAG: hypothetical protein JNK22_17730 [Rhodocyclaceae bacterium]|nr:hypothetical protein [Rhodocyclaceae bacterium]